MSKGAARKLGDGISLSFTSELVPVPRHDQEILDVNTDDLAVVSPNGRNGVE